MGEAKRRRAREAGLAPEPFAAQREQQRLEQLASEDPGDREDRIAHGFTYDDDWSNGYLLCRNGCGLSYPEVVAGKIRACTASEASRRQHVGL